MPEVLIIGLGLLFSEAAQAGQRRGWWYLVPGLAVLLSCHGATAPLADLILTLALAVTIARWTSQSGDRQHPAWFPLAVLLLTLCGLAAMLNTPTRPLANVETLRLTLPAVFGCTWLMLHLGEAALRWQPVVRALYYGLLLLLSLAGLGAHLYYPFVPYYLPAIWLPQLVDDHFARTDRRFGIDRYFARQTVVLLLLLFAAVAGR